jgi:hypothetical protein
MISMTPAKVVIPFIQGAGSARWADRDGARASSELADFGGRDIRCLLK